MFYLSPLKVIKNFVEETLREHLINYTSLQTILKMLVLKCYSSLLDKTFSNNVFVT